MNIELHKSEQLAIISSIEIINAKVNTLGFYVEMDVAKDMRLIITEFFDLLLPHINGMNSFLHTEHLIIESLNKEINSILKSIFRENEDLLKRIALFNSNWNVFEIVRCPRDLRFEFEYLLLKLNARFKLEDSLLYMLEFNNNISQN